jgi:hypothetical protein
MSENRITNIYARPQKMTKLMNNSTYADYLIRLRLLATSVFKWEGLPESVNERFLEQALYASGKALFFKDASKGFLCLTCIPASSINVYHEAKTYHAYSINYDEAYTDENSVLIKNNWEQYPTAETIELFAYRLSKVERTIDINLNHQKTPFFIRCHKNQLMTLKNVINQYEGDEAFILGDTTLDPNNLTAVLTPAPYLIDKLTLYKSDLWNECLTFLGINNSNTDKRERLIVPEVNSNNQFIQASAEVMFMTRKYAADAINKMWPKLTVSVTMRTDFTDILQAASLTDLQPGETGGTTNE